MKYLLRIILFLSVLILTACGQTGPLYLPNGTSAHPKVVDSNWLTPAEEAETLY